MVMFFLGFLIGAISCFLILFMIGLGIQNKQYDRAMGIIESVEKYENKNNINTQQRFES